MITDFLNYVRNKADEYNTDANAGWSMADLIELANEYEGNVEPQIIIKEATTEPSKKTWSYPLEEMSYIFDQIMDGTRENGETFLLYNGRLYESYETETLQKGVIRMDSKELAKKILAAMEDMDYLDYVETYEVEVDVLAREIDKAKDAGLIYILSVLNKLSIV